MTNIKVSVIIPVYNVEKYLEECLDSIVNQSLRETEIICVNDGSTDGSPEILQKYAAKDDRIIICTQENRGLSAARNNGAAQARGKYLYFMDSDDILELSALEILYTRAETDNLDVLRFRSESFTEDTEFEKLLNRRKKFRTCYYDRVYEGHALMSKMVNYGEFSPSPVCQFINRNFYVQNKLGFPEGIIHEDYIFTYRCLLSANRAERLSLKLYRRRIRPNSIVTTAAKKASFANVYGHFISYLEMNRYYKEHNIARFGDEALYVPIKQMLSYSRSYYMRLSPEERQAALALPDDLRRQLQTLVIDVCSKSEQSEARIRKFFAPIARLILPKNFASTGVGRSTIWFLMKVRRAMHCVRDYGFVYTAKLVYWHFMYRR